MIVSGVNYFSAESVPSTQNPCHPLVSLTFPRSPSKQASSPPQKSPRRHSPQLFFKNK